MRIIFVRHGDYKGKKLTRLGRKQAKLVCNDLSYENIGKIYCSPCPRARETAEILAKRLKLGGVEVSSELDERKALKGAPTNFEEQEYADNYLNPNFSKDHPEGLKNFLERTSAFLDRVTKQDYESVLIVGHSSFAYALLTYFTGIKSNKDIVWMRIGNCSKICFDSKQIQ